MLPKAPSSLSLRDLEYAVAVERERHFGRAAETCGVSQATLSEQIRKLEATLDVALFERTKRKIEPTARGAAVLLRARALLDDARSLLDEARRSAEPLSGELRIGVIPTLGPYYLPSVIALARERFPRLSLRLHEAQTNAVLAGLRNGALDAALVAVPTATDGLVVEPLFVEPFLVAHAMTHAFAERERVALADVADGPLLLMEDGHCLRDHAAALCDAKRLAQRTRYASSLEMLRSMIAAGEGVSLIPALAAGPTSAMRELVVYRPLDTPAGRTIALVRRATETRADDFATIARALRDSLPEGVAAA